MEEYKPKHSKSSNCIYLGPNFQTTKNAIETYLNSPDSRESNLLLTYDQVKDFYEGMMQFAKLANKGSEAND